MAKNANEALLYAAERGCIQGVKAALKAGADIDYAGAQDGHEITDATALYIASFLGHADVVRLLIRKGASLTKRSIGKSNSPLLIAAAKGYTEVVELLVRHGATLDTRDAYQRTPLMVACSYKQVDIARRLIEFGARADLTDAKGLTAQQHCVRDVELTKLVQEALQTRLLRCCNTTCGKLGYRSTLKLCARCKLTRYCSRDCQRQHWLIGHQKSCGHDTFSDDGSNPFLKLSKLKTVKQKYVQI
ncbi:uncharacterized protein LOC144919905 [Branchiostoma floridae x Branchiostoma belcheri]